MQSIFMRHLSAVIFFMVTGFGQGALQPAESVSRYPLYPYAKRAAQAAALAGAGWLGMQLQKWMYHDWISPAAQEDALGQQEGEVRGEFANHVSREEHQRLLREREAEIQASLQGSLAALRAELNDVRTGVREQLEVEKEKQQESMAALLHLAEKLIASEQEKANHVTEDQVERRLREAANNVQMAVKHARERARRTHSIALRKQQIDYQKACDEQQARITELQELADECIRERDEERREKEYLLVAIERTRVKRAEMEQLAASAQPNTEEIVASIEGAYQEIIDEMQSQINELLNKVVEQQVTINELRRLLALMPQDSDSEDDGAGLFEVELCDKDEDDTLRPFVCEGALDEEQVIQMFALFQSQVMRFISATTQKLFAVGLPDLTEEDTARSFLARINAREQEWTELGDINLPRVLKALVAMVYNEYKGLRNIGDFRSCGDIGSHIRSTGITTAQIINRKLLQLSDAILQSYHGFVNVKTIGKCTIIRRVYGLCEKILLLHEALTKMCIDHLHLQSSSHRTLGTQNAELTEIYLRLEELKARMEERLQKQIGEISEYFARLGQTGEEAFLAQIDLTSFLDEGETAPAITDIDDLSTFGILLIKRGREEAQNFIRENVRAYFQRTTYVFAETGDLDVKLEALRERLYEGFDMVFAQGNNGASVKISQYCDYLKGLLDEAQTWQVTRDE